MVEVFKTNVQHAQHARILLDEIEKLFVNYRATFDLGDCDKILRVESKIGPVQSSSLIDLLYDYGYVAKVLEDEVDFKPDVEKHEHKLF